ncbi:NADH:ubiquinone reductase (Na(+)-transporting) subunit D [Rhodobacteraceae bacterium N5(2021)]|uniref:NADH:ubiquinone reductase (Na(+)-transporting) subunit D n=1 Tax=Gymnodinialimonas phycosphaerae TaxID=2841589 RepID=A0A975YEQ5_9RHOB|nr:NADH:ubiquinone reductase (Na(+)-transporting) subunit D [Gymnodinialimonas phycosphaerae]MBY4893862.1 NADH:ubiquinone reductase (Na(+)-transporting) subunit D [Gymnodinialimonas phycosphaerae]
MRKALTRIIGPLIDQNPITRQILGVCSALAVTTSLDTALVMSAALTTVLCLSSGIISLLRHHIPHVIRLIVQITIIASLVIVIDEFMRAYVFELSRTLSVFVGLIVTNCLVLGRAEAFAMRNPVGPSVLDALGNGLGYSLILIVVGSIRELLGEGSLLGLVILPSVEDGGWFQPLGLMQLAPAAFFIIGLLVWAVRSLRRDQIEPAQYSLSQTRSRG